MDKLTTAIREIHNSPSVWRPAITIPGPHPASAFVQQLWQRYAAQPVRWPQAALIWRRLPAAGQLQQHIYSPRFELAPRLALTVLHQPAGASPRPRLQPAVTPRRVEAIPVAGDSTPEDQKRAPLAAQTAALRPAPRVVVRPAEPVPAPPASPPSPPPPFSAGWSPPSPVALQPGDPTADINRLTDQVVRAIDQRIIAERERLGRL